jgi:DNA-binding XRE family transcriptional regulator
MGKLKLKAARVNAGYSQSRAAKALGISNKTLSNWETYKTFPKQPMIEKLCNLYGLTYDAIDFRG